MKKFIIALALVFGSVSVANAAELVVSKDGGEIYHAQIPPAATSMGFNLMHKEKIGNADEKLGPIVFVSKYFNGYTICVTDYYVKSMRQPFDTPFVMSRGGCSKGITSKFSSVGYTVQIQ